MSTTSAKQGWPLPTSSDAANVPADMAALAAAAEVQSVMLYASTAARDASLTAPTEGMTCWVTGTNRLYIYDGSAWRIVAGDMPRVSMYRSAAATMTTAVAYDVAWDTEVFDPDGGHSGSGTTYAVPTGMGGLWQIIGQGGFATNATGYRLCQIKVNGSVVASTRIPAGGSASNLIQVSHVAILAATDTIGMAMTQTSGGDLAIVAGANDTWLRARYLAPTIA